MTVYFGKQIFSVRFLTVLNLTSHLSTLTTLRLLSYLQTRYSSLFIPVSEILGSHGGEVIDFGLLG
jgi:hypothetical protein